MPDSLAVLFVCTANICRSPTMELVARDLAGGARIYFGSAGTHARDGEPMNPDMVATLPPGMDSAEFRSQHLGPGLLLEADLVLTATGVHRQFILDDFPQHHRKLFTLGQFAETIAQIPDRRGRALVEAAGTRRTPAAPGHDVADPYRRGKAACEKATGTITAMLSDIVPRLAAVES
jgi:protein-tyrosine-phosphatase